MFVSHVIHPNMSHCRKINVCVWPALSKKVVLSICKMCRFRSIQFCEDLCQLICPTVSDGPLLIVPGIDIFCISPLLGLSHQSTLMSIHNICFQGEINQIFIGYTLSGDMIHVVWSGPSLSMYVMTIFHLLWLTYVHMHITSLIWVFSVHLQTIWIFHKTT